MRSHLLFAEHLLCAGPERCPAPVRLELLEERPACWLASKITSCTVRSAVRRIKQAYFPL